VVLFISIVKVVALLGAGAIVGNWFLSEVKKTKVRKDPWYEPYLSPPGIIILIAICLPVMAWLIRKFQ